MSPERLAGEVLGALSEIKNEIELNREVVSGAIAHQEGNVIGRLDEMTENQQAMLGELREAKENMQEQAEREKEYQQHMMKQAERIAASRDRWSWPQIVVAGLVLLLLFVQLLAHLVL